MIAAVAFALVSVAAFVAGFYFGQATERRAHAALRISQQLPKMEEQVAAALHRLESRAKGHATPEDATEHPAGPPPPMPDSKRRLMPWMNK